LAPPLRSRCAYPHSESTLPPSRKILAGVPDEEQGKVTGGNTARVYNFNAARLAVAAEAPPLRIDVEAPWPGGGRCG